MAGGYSLVYPNMRPRKVEFSFPIKWAVSAVSGSIEDGTSQLWYETSCEYYSMKLHKI